MYWRVKTDNANYMAAAARGIHYNVYELLGIDEKHKLIDEDKLLFEHDIDSGFRIPHVFPTSYHPVLIVDDFAFQSLKSFFENYFSIRRGKIDSKEVMVLSCSAERDGFDHIRSVFTRYNLPAPRNRINRIIDLKIKEGFHSDIDLFRLSGEWAIRLELIASDAFKNACDLQNVTGFKFVSAD